jgi:pSer/pThr/pTyr-binding forkhead associated (FHA) protein
MPFLVIYHTGGMEEEREVVSQLTMGRSDGNDVVLAEGGVSRRHARFFLDGGELWVEDLGSANGTFVDGERINSPVRLEDKAQVQIGDCEMVVRLSKAIEAIGEHTQLKAAVSQDWDEATVGVQKKKAGAIIKRQAVQAHLVCVGAPEDGKRFELVGTCVVGRMPDTEIQIEDSSISRRHAEVVVRADGSIWLTDLGSANGTVVNGEPVRQALSLSNGDVIHFGTVEMHVQLEGPQAAKKPRRNALARRPEQRLAASRHEEEEVIAEAGAVDTEGTPRRKKMLFIVAATFVVFSLLAVVLKLMPSSFFGASGTAGPPTPLLPTRDSEAMELEKALRECRQHLQVDARSIPNYELARQACTRALDIDPLHNEANRLKQKIALESECASYFEQGKQAVDLFEPEKALEFFEKIDPECKEYRRRAVEPYESARRETEDRAKKDCLKYSKVKTAESWRLAYEQCAIYMKLICRSMSDEELYPPGGKNLVLSTGALKRNEWRPSNEYYRSFLMARSQVDPHAPTWRCPEEDGDRFSIHQLDGKGKEAEAKKWFADRFKQADFEQAIFSYYIGKTQDALNKLSAVRNDMRKTNLHEDANRLQVQIRQVDAFFGDGMLSLEKGNVQDAAERFQNALEKDKVLMLGEVSGMDELEERAALNNHLRSFFRNNVMVDMPNKCLSIGEDWRKRNNPKRACQIWKVGHHFNKNNTDLLLSLTSYCTSFANELYGKASNCSDLREVLEYAVEGDGLRQKVEKLQSDNDCR